MHLNRSSLRKMNACELFVQSHVPVAIVAPKRACGFRWNDKRLVYNA